MVHDLRAMCDAVAYVVRNGVEWRAVPVDFPPWDSVFAFYQRWNARGLPQSLVTRLRERLRERQGRSREPSACIIDSQIVKCADTVGKTTSGYHGGKKITGRGRHVVVDTEGWLLALVVVAASVSDKAGAKLLAARLAAMFATLRLMWADACYNGKPLRDLMSSTAGITLEIVKRTSPHSFQVSQLREARSGTDRRALLNVQAQYAEFAGWLHQDLGDFDRARHWLDRALELSHAAGDQEMATYILARKSQLAGDMHDGAGSVDLAYAAQGMARPRSKLAAVAPTYAAHGHALLGEERETLRALDDADDGLGNLDHDPASRWASWLDPAYIAVQRARCLEILGHHGQAAAIFQQAISGLPPAYRRDRGVYLAREARAHAHAADPDRAADSGMHALVITAETGSGRIVSELARLDIDLAAWRSVPGVADFRHALTEVIPTQTTSRESD